MRIIVWGGDGRLGRALQIEASRCSVAIIAVAGRDGLPPNCENADVLIDASAPSALDAVIGHCRSTGTALVECVSNLSQQQLVFLREASSEIPILRAENLTFGHFMQERIIELVASLLRGPISPHTVAVVERHPLTKVHRPSATAQRLATVWEAMAGYAVGDIASIRAGNPVSDHSVIVSLPGACLTVEHIVTDLAAAASGALIASRWLMGRSSGLYGVDAVYRDLVATN